MPTDRPTPAAIDLREIARELAQTMRCNCDLDSWEPELSTGHSWVCRIHHATLAEKSRRAGRTYTYPFRQLDDRHG